MMGNKGSYTVITGASSGLGYEAAKAFAGRGSNLILAARRKDRMEDLRREILEEHPALDVAVKVVDLSVPENVVHFYEDVKGYPLGTWVNSAGFGNYGSVGSEKPGKLGRMLCLNVEALAILSSLFVRDFKNVCGAQLINVSSCGGYTVVPDAVAYCGTKFFVSAFTEGLDLELKKEGAKMRAKVFAPAATRTEFGKVANDVREYDYDRMFGKYHTAAQAAAFLLELYDSEKTVGLVDREDFSFILCEPRFPYAGESRCNQKK